MQDHYFKTEIRDKENCNCEMKQILFENPTRNNPLQDFLFNLLYLHQLIFVSLKRDILLLVSVIQAPFLEAQNLVPNPSFEDTIHCPYTVSMGVNDQLSYSAGWYTPTGASPDYYKDRKSVV